MFVFFTIPFWLILLVIVMIAAGAGAIINWIAVHVVAISIVIWTLIAILTLKLCDRKEYIGWISLVATFIPPYVLFVSGLLDVAHKFQKGDFLELILYIPALVMSLVEFVPSLFLFTFEIGRWENGTSLNRYVVLNLFFIALGVLVCYRLIN